MEEFNLCLQPGFLRVIYMLKVFLNIIRFVVPVILIVKTIFDFYKNVIDPNNKEGLKSIKNRVIACIIVFLVPTFINLLMNFVENIVGASSYNGVTECWTFANLEYIETIEKERKEEELTAYLTEKEQLLSKSDQYKLAIQKIVESNKKSSGVGKYANNTNQIKCNTGSSYNNDLYNVVRTAGYKTREGVVAAAIYLSSQINVHIPYFWSGGHFHTYNGYYDGGDSFMGVSDKWGCNVKMAFGGTDAQKNGVNYPFGMDCSGFVTWSIYNGGYYTGDSSQELRFATNTSMLKSIGGVSVSSVKIKNAKGKVKPGDIAYKSGHVGLVVEVHDSYLMIAEEASYKKGLIVSKVKYNRFTDIVLMDNFYENYKKNSPMWDGFK